MEDDVVERLLVSYLRTCLALIYFADCLYRRCVSYDQFTPAAYICALPLLF